MRFFQIFVLISKKFKNIFIQHHFLYFSLIGYFMNVAILLFINRFISQVYVISNKSLVHK